MVLQYATGVLLSLLLHDFEFLINGHGSEIVLCFTNLVSDSGRLTSRLIDLILLHGFGLRLQSRLTWLRTETSISARRIDYEFAKVLGGF